MRWLLASLREALRALWTHKLRSLLTMLSIVIGVLSIAGLLSVALGVRRQVTEEIESLGSTTVAVIPGRVRTESGGLNPIASLGASTLTERDVESIRRDNPEVRNVTPALLISGTVHTDTTTAPSSVIFAATREIAAVLNFEISRGRFLGRPDEDAHARVLVLGDAPARDLFPNENPLNRTVELRGERFQVIGVLKKKTNAAGFFGPSFNNVVILPLSTGWEITGTRQIFRIFLEAPNTDAVNNIRDRVAATIRRTHGDEEDFTVLTQEEILGIAGNILTLLTRMTGAVAAISLVVGGINIMNIMLVSVTERTREIGIRKALGATRLHILVQFLAEAFALSLFGGTVGVVLARIGVATAARFSGIPVDMPLTVILFALLFSASIGILFGLAPALRASWKDPIEALRSE